MSNDFGILLRMHRKEKGFSQTQLLEELQEEGHEIYSKGTISKWEKGTNKPKIDVVEDLEVILDLPKGTLLKVAGYSVEIGITEQEQMVTDQFIASLNRKHHFDDLVEVCNILLANGLDKKIFYRKIGEQDVYYYDDDFEEQQITQSQLAAWLENNIDEANRKDEWFFWECFLTHLQAECPNIDFSDLAEATGNNAFQIIETLQTLAHKKRFKGNCRCCPGQ